MKQTYVCIECGYETSKWMGRCVRCGKWGSLKKVSKSDRKGKDNHINTKVKIRNIKSIRKIKKDRFKTGFSEFDRVLGGGFVKGEVIIIGGKPGVGKTTLLLQVLNNVILDKGKCVYVSAEESIDQLSIHAKRLNLSDKLDIICSDDIDSIINVFDKEKQKLVIVDSIQTIKTNDLKSLPGGIGQVKECTSRIVNFAKRTGIAVVIVGHITKGGELAGPKVVEHLVDAVFYLEGESDGKIRFLKGVKNRFGSTREIGIFNFTNGGFSDSKNLSEMFILSKKSRIGVCKGVTFEGRRALLIEVQALIVESTYGVPQRVVNGVSKSKVQMLSAVLSKYTKANFLNKDIYINIANGIKTKDSSLDLSVSIAMLSSFLNKKVNSQKVAIGEVSLTGQVKSSGMIKEKLKALKSLGYDKIVIPNDSFKKLKKTKGIILVDSVSDLVSS